MKKAVAEELTSNIDKKTFTPEAESERTKPEAATVKEAARGGSATAAGVAVPRRGRATAPGEPSTEAAVEEHPAGAPVATESPRWGGRSGHVGYLAKMFPRISETFILNEVLALKRHGVPVCIYSLLEPIRDQCVHPEATALMDEVRILPEPSSHNVNILLWDLWSCFRTNPAATYREVLRLAARPGRRTYSRLFRAARLAVLLREDEVAHLHAAWAHTPASVCRIASRLSGIPWSMGTHAKDIFLSQPSSLKRKLAAARFTLSCTRSHKKFLEGLGESDDKSLPAPSVSLFYHGVDTEYFTGNEDSRRDADTGDANSSFAAASTKAAAVMPVKRAESSLSTSRVPVILSVGRLVPKKGFDTLIDAAARLHQKGITFRLEIIGEGPLRDSLEHQIRRLSLERVVTLCGMRVREEVHEAYRRAACAVLACRVTSDGDRDGIPNTVAEAMACGLPVVATYLPGIAEIVDHRRTGLLVRPDDPAALAYALMTILHDPKESRRMGRQGREDICRKFNAEEWGCRLARRFDKTLGVEKVLYLSADRGVPVSGTKGASVHLRSLVRAFKDMDVDSLIITTRPGAQDGPSIPARMVEARTPAWLEAVARRVGKWTRTGPVLERELLRLLDNIFVLRKGYRMARAWHPDVVYERYALTAIAGSLLSRRLGVPHVLEVNAPLADEEAKFRGLRAIRMTRWLEGLILRRADMVVAVSRPLKEHVMRLGVLEEKVVVLANGVDPRLFYPGRDGGSVRRCLGLDGAFVIGFSGSLKPWHGVDVLLRAVARVVPYVPSIQLVLVGEGPQKQTLQDIGHKLNLDGRVHFVGPVPHEAVPDYLAACDILAAPYTEGEGCYFSPLKLAEYLAIGRPVVASSSGWIRDSMDESQGVVFVPPRDEVSLGNAIAELARDAVRRESLAWKATCARKWTWADVARRVLCDCESLRRARWRWGR